MSQSQNVTTTRIQDNISTSGQPPIHLTIYPVLDSTDVIYVLESQTPFSASLFTSNGQVLRPIDVQHDGLTYSATIQAPCDVYLCTGREGLVFSLNAMGIPEWAREKLAVAR